MDAHDRPALLRAPGRRGALILCTYPVEYMAAVTPEANPDAASTLYDALASYAGVAPAGDRGRPAGGRRRAGPRGRSHFAWLVSHAAEPVTVKPQLSAGSRLCELDGTPASETITLAPFGVGVFASTPRRPPGRQRQLAATMALACALSSRAAALVALPGSLSQMMR